HTVQVRNDGGNRSNPVTLTIVPPAPILRSIVPRVVFAGSGAFTMFLGGLNFAPGAKMLIDETPIATTFINEVDLRATVPASFTAVVGTHLVLVLNGDGKRSNSTAFEVIPPATIITSITPANAIAGGSDFAMVMKGANFKNNAVVLFDGADLATTFRTPSELLAQVPASLIARPGVHSITAQNPNEPPSNDVIFQVFPEAPLIESLSPSSVIEGSGEVTVTIVGQKFQQGAVVRNLGTTQRGPALDTTFLSAESLYAKIPGELTQSSGSVVLAVENPDLGLSNTVELKVLIRDPLVINEFLADPADSLAGDANGDGARSSSADEFIEILNRSGEPFDVSGYKILDADGVRHVFAAGTVVPPFEAAVVFGGGTATGAFGNAAENQMVFKASTGGLSLNNGGDTIILQDAQGRVVQRLEFGAAEGGANQSLNRDPDGDGALFTLHSIVAADASRLFSPGSTAAGQTFTIKPIIGKITPASIRLGSIHFTLTVSGSRFLPGAVVLFGNTTLVTTFRSETQLEAQVPANLVSEGGAADVRVKNPRGELSGITRLLIADDPPQVLGITPETTGTGAENPEISVSGERFQRGAVVQIQGQTVETIFVSSTSLVAVMPSSLCVRAAWLPLLVLNADGNQSNSVLLTVENGPLITRLSRGKIKAGSGDFELTVGGVAFKQGVILFADGLELDTTFVNEGSLTARIPAEMTAQARVVTLQARNNDGGRSNTAKLRVK
ncbi:MAG TPA: lamin tail domain-containing protein, partial [Blastocatellia bacterium]|nr:lamin tail domain-containing protein [Blastocatellia bacterium]